jgi:hypothetical protein
LQKPVAGLVPAGKAVRFTGSLCASPRSFPLRIRSGCGDARRESGIDESRPHYTVGFGHAGSKACLR